jgi:peptidoglycan/xylan/chitin deacetylase (PgdA/CDA1 family)
LTKINVFITIDTEHSIGGAFLNPSLKPVGNDKRIYGRLNGREYGIPLMMDIADRYGIPLTFFVEVFNRHYFGDSETREVCHYIMDRGYDVQLHLHPAYMNFTEAIPSALKYSDNMFSYSLETQIEFIKQGKDILAKYCGRSPIAFRAGNYAADLNTLRALKANGLLIDSSYNLAFPNFCLKISPDRINDAAQIASVWEFPITTFRQFLYPHASRFRPLDLNAVSSAEFKALFSNMQDTNRPTCLTIILHSFSFLKPRDMQYQHCTVNERAIERFTNLCLYLNNNHDLFSPQFLFDAPQTIFQIPAVDTPYVYRMPPHLSLLRSIQQFFN